MNDHLEPEAQGTEYAEPAVEPVLVNDHFVGRLADLVTRPSRLMTNVGLHPRWWQAGLLIFLIMTAFTWLTLPITGPEQMELMRDSKLSQLVPEEDWQARYDAAMDPPPAQRIGQAVAGGATSWVMVLLFSFVLGFFARMSGGQGGFRQALGIVHWASLIPFGIAVIIRAPLVLATESVARVNIGLAALLPDADPTSAVYQILSTYGDFSNWWGLFVLIVGFRVVYRMAAGAAAVAVLLPWALAVAVPVALTLLFM